jgi:hypothetical protein
MKQPDVAFCFMSGAKPKYRPGWFAPTPQMLLPLFLKLKIELRNGFNYNKQSIHSLVQLSYIIYVLKTLFFVLFQTNALHVLHRYNIASSIAVNAVIVTSAIKL